MSAYAKSIVAAVAAVLIAGVTTWQAAAVDGFRWVDVLPVAVAVASAVLTYLVPNVPELPWAKGAVSMALAVLTALSTFITGHPAEVNVANLLIAGLGALLTWYVPNLELAPVGVDGVPLITGAQPPAQVADEIAWQSRTRSTEPSPADDREITDALRDLDEQDRAAAATTPIPGAWRPPTPAAVAAEPTPIADDVAAATTGRIPTVTG